MRRAVASAEKLSFSKKHRKLIEGGEHMYRGVYDIIRGLDLGRLSRGGMRWSNVTTAKQTTSDDVS